MRRTLLIAALGIALALGATAIAGSWAWRSLTSPMAVPEVRVLFDVPTGTPLRRVATDLADRGILAHPRLLTWYARFNGSATRIHAGEYELRSGTTPLELLDLLVSGQVFMHQATIVEGWRFAEMLRALRAHPAIVPTELDGEAIMAELGKPGVHPEGQFLPDTYSFPKGTQDLDVLRRAHAALQEALDDAWARRSPDVHVQTPYEALVLASIVEKETALPTERRLIAGVFNERLKRGMRLQTDPAVIYGLGDLFDGNLRRRDLSSDTPYNTYTRGGLPPTPIALPSANSIDAAVDPEGSGALYFVATGLPDGSHYFSATLEEHNRAVQRYLRRQRAPEEQP